MSSTPRYFLIEDGQRTGPHSEEVLRQKAQVHAITPDTPLSVESAPDAWTALRELPELAALLFPPRPHYTLAPRSIERVNNTGAETAPSVQDLLRVNLTHEGSTDQERLAPLAKRPNRRLRDYLFLAVCGNAFAALAWILIPASPFTHVPLFSFVILFNISLPWVLFGVMDRY